MSTIYTLYLNEKRGVHIFHDLKSGNVVVEIDGDNNLHIFFCIMSFDEWQRHIMYPPTSAERKGNSRIAPSKPGDQ